MALVSTRVEHEGRSYEVVTDETKRNAMLHSYVQVYRLRKDGTRGHRLVTMDLVYGLLQLSRRD